MRKTKGGLMYSELRVLMLKNRISMLELSKLIGVSRNTISDKLNGKTKFTIEEITKIRDTYFPTISLDIICKKV